MNFGDNSSLFCLIIILAGALILYLYVKKFKRLKISNVYFIDGAVKTGKSVVSVWLAVKTYKRNLRNYYLTLPLRLFICHLRNEKFEKKIYKPMLYSNIPLRNVRYNRFTEDILFRRVRIPNKSVILLDEVSLLADSMLYKDDEVNKRLMLFYKLFGHYSHGGTLIANSQQIGDNHYSLKRSIGRYLYIYNRTKFPFLTRIKAVEQIYTDDNSTVNNNVGDLEDNTKKLLFFNRYYKYYDCYCYSVFTDENLIYVNYDERILRRRDSLKCEHLVSLQNFGAFLDMRKKNLNNEENTQIS